MVKAKIPGGRAPKLTFGRDRGTRGQEQKEHKEHRGHEPEHSDDYDCESGMT